MIIIIPALTSLQLSTPHWVPNIVYPVIGELVEKLLSRKKPTVNIIAVPTMNIRNKGKTSKIMPAFLFIFKN